MQRIIFQNDGEIEKGALTLLGASTKREDQNKIGMFGSGNKYALAYLIRNGYDVLIYSGEKTIEIGTKTERLSGQVFDVITVDGEKTSITTTTGPQWTLWQAIRELYSNAIDEGGADMYFGPEADLKPTAGKTTIVVSHPDSHQLQKFWIEQDRYFAWQRTDKIEENEDGTIYRQPSKTVYRRGIRCIEDMQGKLFLRDYDLPRVSINEERLVKHKYEMMHAVWNIYLSSKNVALIKNFLESLNKAFYDGISRDLFEWNGYLNNSFSIPDRQLDPDTWKAALGDYKVAKERDRDFVSNPNRTYILPNCLVNHIISKLGNDYDGVQFRLDGSAGYKTVENPALVDNVFNSMQRLEKVDCEIEVKTIQPVIFSQSDKLVTIDQDRLLVSEKMQDYSEEQTDKAMLRVWSVQKGLGREEPEVLLDAFYKYVFKKQ